MRAAPCTLRSAANLTNGYTEFSTLSKAAEHPAEHTEQPAEHRELAEHTEHPAEHTEQPTEHIEQKNLRSVGRKSAVRFQEKI